MKKFLLLSVIAVFALFVAGNAWATIYTPSQSDIDTFYEVSSGTLTGPDMGSPITVGSDGHFDVSISPSGGTWDDVQIGRDATIEGPSSAYYSGKWADLSGYNTYELCIRNTSTTNDWFMANIYLNTGWTDQGETDYYYQNGWVWVAPNTSVHMLLDLSTAVSSGGGGGAGHLIDNLGHVSSLGFNIGSHTGVGDYYGADLDGKATPVPIPTSVLLLGSGLLGLIGVGRFRFGKHK